MDFVLFAGSLTVARTSTMSTPAGNLAILNSNARESAFWLEAPDVIVRPLPFDRPSGEENVCDFDELKRCIGPDAVPVVLA